MSPIARRGASKIGSGVPVAAVEGAILLVDATKGIQAQTLANLKLAQKQHLVIIPAVNKVDLPFARTDEVAKSIAELLRIDEKEIFITNPVKFFIRIA